jgi:hypothetical protein
MNTSQKEDFQHPDRANLSQTAIGNSGPVNQAGGHISTAYTRKHVLTISITVLFALGLGATALVGFLKFPGGTLQLKQTTSEVAN